VKRIAFVVCLLGLSNMVGAASLWSGTWEMRDDAPDFRLTMTVEDIGTGRRLTYKLTSPATKDETISGIVTPLDGTDAPMLVDGMPWGQTMAIRMVDSRHSVTVLKFQGKQTGISKAELSADGKVMKAEDNNTLSSPNGLAGKHVARWDKQYRT